MRVCGFLNFIHRAYMIPEDFLQKNYSRPTEERYRKNRWRRTMWKLLKSSWRRKDYKGVIFWIHCFGVPAKSWRLASQGIEYSWARPERKAFPLAPAIQLSLILHCWCSKHPWLLLHMCSWKTSRNMAGSCRYGTKGKRTMGTKNASKQSLVPAVLLVPVYTHIRICVHTHF